MSEQSKPHTELGSAPSPASAAVNTGKFWPLSVRTVCAVLLPAAALASPAGLSWLDTGWWSLLWLGILALSIVGASVVIPPLLNGTSSSSAAGDAHTDATMYNRYQTGLGLAILLLSIAMFVTLAGYAWTARLDRIVPMQPATQPVPNPLPAAFWAEHRIAAVRLLISVAMAVLGGLFFTANAMQSKKQGPEAEAFDRGAFWSGLFFRVGEAVLFTLTFFLAFRLFGISGGDLWVPLLGLVVGMFVKSGEHVVARLAKRVFEAVCVLIPVSAEDVCKAQPKRSDQRSMPIHQVSAPPSATNERHPPPP